MGMRRAIQWSLVLILLAGCIEQDGPPRAAQGVLDLTQWSFADRGAVGLDGQWEFHWNQLLEPPDFPVTSSAESLDYLSVPGFWNRQEIDARPLPKRGFATYRLLIRLPEARPPLALKLLNIHMAYRLWIDGGLKAELGKVGTDRAGTLPYGDTRLVELPSSSGEVEVVLQVACFRLPVCGVADRITLGGKDQLTRRQRIAGGFILLGIGGLFIMGLYHLVLFVLRPKDPAPLYFGILCLIIGLWTTMNPNGRFLLTLFPSLSWEWQFRINYVLMTLTIPVLIMFIQALFPREAHVFVLRVYQAIALVFLLIVEAAPDHLFILNSFFPVLFSAMAYIVLVLVRAIRINRDGSAYLLTGFALLTLAAVNDSLYNARVIQSAYLTLWAMLLFVISQSFVLSLRFSKAFVAVERLSGELEEKNTALSRLVKLKDEFLTNTSHELRTPLTGIIGIAESLVSGLGGKLPDVVSSHLKMIVSSGRRLSHLVNDVLDHSRLKHRDIALAPRPLDLKMAVDTVLALSRELARGKAVELRNEIPADTPPVHADADRLQQILFNLVGNAVKFTDRGSIVVSAAEREAMVEIAVSDTGAGIPEDALATIFERYEQVEPGGAKSLGGTGLGLSITKKLVQLHGGDIRAESETGRGSVFRFTLAKSFEEPRTGASATVAGVVDTPQGPRVSNPAGAFPAPLPAPVPPEPEPETRVIAHARPGHVLIVDDEPVNRHVISSHLALEDIPVRTAANGKETLEMLERGEMPALVLLDVMMPDLSGYEVCRRLRESLPPATLPVIMLTARNRIADLVEGFGAGANDYLTKPFSREELVARVKTQLELRNAYETLKENLALKRELALRERTVLDLKLMQRRLTEMLNAVDEAMVAVNASREIGFCNRPFEALTGHAADNLLGHSVHSIFADPEHPTVQSVVEVLGEEGISHGETLDYRGLAIKRSGGGRFDGNLLLTSIELEDERLYLLILTRASLPGTASPIPAMDIIEGLERHGKRRQHPDRHAGGTPAGYLDSLPPDAERHDVKRSLAVAAMKLSLDYWSAATRSTKVRLADRSRIWNVYIEKDGNARTQTLDRYLSERTLPRKPRWNKVCATADFVLTYCKTPSPLRTQLETALSGFKAVL